MRRRFALLALIFAAALVSAQESLAQARGAPTAAAPAQTELVRFSFAAGWDGLPGIVAVERGFFAEENLVVSGLPSSSAEAVLKSVAVGSTDVASVPQRTFLVMAAANLPVRVIAMSGWGRPIQLVVPGSETAINEVADLKGKRVALVQASEAYPILMRLLNAARLRPTDVKPVFLTADALTNVFETRSADAVFETQHYTDALTAAKNARVVLSNEAIVQQLGLINAAPLVANADMIARRPEIVQRFVNAWVRAQKYIQQDPVDASKLLQVFLHRQGVIVSEELAMSWTRLTQYDKYLWSGSDIADADYNGWGLKEGGILKVQPKVAGYVENAFAERAVSLLR